MKPEPFEIDLATFNALPLSHREVFLACLQDGRARLVENKNEDGKPCA